MQKVFRPQPGPQVDFLRSSADIVIYGGAAGGGKSFALLMEAARAVRNPKYAGVIFRRTSPQITAPGGLWDAAANIYPSLGAKPLRSQNRLEWVFPSGARVSFRHLQHDTDKFAWQGAELGFVGFDELTHFCYNPLVETLTETGWKKIADVQVGEKVLSLTPEGIARYETVTCTWERDFDGVLHETKNRSIRYSVTPTHKMVIRRQGYKGWQFCDAEKLDEYPRFPFDSEWEGTEAKWHLLPPVSGRGIGRNQNSVERIAADTYIAFMGWYLSEGSSFLMARKRNASPCIYIRQTKLCPELNELMSVLPLRSRFTAGGGYRIFSKQLYTELKPLGNLYQKRIPRWILRCSRRQLQIFLDAFVLGDGHKNKNGSINIGLANEGLIDDLQEVAVKLGYRATKSVGKGGKNKKYDVFTLYIHSRQGGLVHDRPDNKQEVPYKGKVHCITVEPSHTLLTRYQGRVSWSGNCESQFWYLLSRNRSTIGIRPYVRATTNPAPGWVRALLAPWVDAAFPFPAVSGEVRRFVRREGELFWLAPDDPDDPDQKTLCFVRASVFDNPALLGKNPEYVSNLRALPTVEMRRLLEGDWNVFEGAFFDEFSEVRHAITAPYTPDSPPPPHWNYFGGLDWGFASPFAFGLLAADENGDVHVIESVQQARLTNDAQADKVLGILSKWGVKPSQCPIAYDPSMDNKHRARNAPGFVGEADIEAFHRAGLLCAPADNNRQAGWSKVRRFLHTDRLKIWKGYNADLLRFLPMAPFSETDPEDQAAGEWEHLLDMLRYSLRNRVPPARVDAEALDPRTAPKRLVKRQKDEKRRL